MRQMQVWADEVKLIMHISYCPTLHRANDFFQKILLESDVQQEVGKSFVGKQVLAIYKGGNSLNSITRFGNA